MTVLSILRGGVRPKVDFKSLAQTCKVVAPTVSIRNLGLSAIQKSGHAERFHITPSRYQWHLYKDQFHFYIMLGVIPLTMLVFFVNIFIGPATLSEIPEGYTPKHWEYHKHPITRWLARYFFIAGPQEAYERNLHYIAEEDELRKMRLLAWKVESRMKDQGDYPNFYQHKIIHTKYARAHIRQNFEDKFYHQGNND